MVRTVVPNSASTASSLGLRGHCLGGPVSIGWKMPLSLLNLALFAACDQTKVVGQYLSSLASSGYDHFTRPNGLNGAAEQIEVQLKVLHLKNVDHMSNRVSLLAFFRRYWVDPRLAFAGTPAEDCNRDISVPTLTPPRRRAARTWRRATARSPSAAPPR